jgi:cytochrome c553
MEREFSMGVAVIPSAALDRSRLLARHRWHPLWIAVAAAVLSLPLSVNAAERAKELLAKTLALAANANAGGQAFARNCAGCHGDKAWGVGDASIPALAGQRERYLLTQLIDFAELNRDAVEMHRASAALGIAPEQQWRNIAAYLARLPMNPRPQKGDGKSLDNGSGIYRDSCASCHREDGMGDDSVAAPALAGQHYSYVLMQIRGMASGHRFTNVDFDLALMLDNMSAADMAAVADYISRLSAMPTAAQLLP